MKKSIHSESEMVKAVKELESGVSAEVVARKHGVTRATCITGSQNTVIWM